MKKARAVGGGTRRHEEIDAQRAVLDGLRGLRFVAWRNQKGVIPIWAGYGASRRIVATRKTPEAVYTNGLPDILAILHPQGRLLGIEMKSSTGKPSDEQDVWRERFIGAGAECIVARGWDEVLSFLIAQGYVQKPK